MKKLLITLMFAPIVAFSQSTSQDAFLRQQAYAEMQRVVGQVDTLQTNIDDLSARVKKIEAGSNTAVLQAEVASLKSAIVELRQEIANQRAEIVKDLSSRIAKMQPKDPPPKAAPREPVVISGPTDTYTVQGGDSLYLIAKAFNTTVSKLKAMNNLKSDKLKIGQQLIVPHNN